MRYNNDKKLIHGCISQNKKAWDTFVKKYSKVISYGIVHTLKKYSVEIEDHVVEDLFHTTFLSLLENDYKKLRQFRWNCKLSGWLHLIAARTTIDYLRKQKQSLSLDQEDEDNNKLSDRIPDEKPLADEAFEIVEEKKYLETLIKSLKPREQFFIQLYVIQELSVPEISKLMKITPNNVYQIKNRVFGKMKMIAQSL